MKPLDWAHPTQTNDARADLAAACERAESASRGAEPVPCGRIASMTHCCEYHAIHSDDDFAKALDLLDRFICADSQWPIGELKDEARALIRANQPDALDLSEEEETAVAVLQASGFDDQPTACASFGQGRTNDPPYLKPAAPARMVRAYVGGGEYEMVPETAAPARTKTVVAEGDGITITAVSVTDAERAGLNTGGARLPPLDDPECPRCRLAEDALTDGIAESMRLYARTEADQAVLDAMTEVPERTLRYHLSGNFYASPDLESLCRAELARRGLKP